MRRPSLAPWPIVMVRCLAICSCSCISIWGGQWSFSEENIQEFWWKTWEKETFLLHLPLFLSLFQSHLFLLLPLFLLSSNSPSLPSFPYSLPPSSYLLFFFLSFLITQPFILPKRTKQLLRVRLYVNYDRKDLTSEIWYNSIVKTLTHQALC